MFSDSVDGLPHFLEAKIEKVKQTHTKSPAVEWRPLDESQLLKKVMFIVCVN